jgi:hypothetical protein
MNETARDDRGKIMMDLAVIALWSVNNRESAAGQKWFCRIPGSLGEIRRAGF